MADSAVNLHAFGLLQAELYRGCFDTCVAALVGSKSGLLWAEQQLMTCTLVWLSAPRMPHVGLLQAS